MVSKKPNAKEPKAMVAEEPGIKGSGFLSLLRRADELAVGLSDEIEGVEIILGMVGHDKKNEAVIDTDGAATAYSWIMPRLAGTCLANRARAKAIGVRLCRPEESEAVDAKFEKPVAIADEVTDIWRNVLGVGEEIMSAIHKANGDHEKYDENIHERKFPEGGVFQIAADIVKICEANIELIYVLRREIN